ncbi:hypothetical protein HTV45_12650 [Streptomyces sp. CHD11]|uniref:LppU/SCO3897 family protein n=1 Tax=Streptomyces sp. CHD11 TaxID=2741325 RepID=UPI001BFC892D|nr:hypothetical protein [Streptomyces sp. CHD11]MBT3151725.1 hypothetical protein [Streptomyces sp. CHD11]
MTTPPPQGNPFAQGQPQHQGQAPHPPQGGFPQAGQPGFPPPGAPVPPPAPARRFNKTLIRIVGFIVIAVLIAVGKWFFGQTDAETASVGSCMHNKGTQVAPDLKGVDCSSSDAQYKVVEKFDDTSDSDKCEAVKEATISYYQTGDSSHNVVLCLKEVK